MLLRPRRPIPTLFRSLIPLAIAAACAWESTGTADAFRPALSGEQRTIAAEVQLTFRMLADSPDSGFAHGLEIVLTPICVSTSDPRYASAIANPIEAGGNVGQPAEVFLHRAPGGYRVVGDIRIGARANEKPAAVTKAAWLDLHGHCNFVGVLKLKKLRAAHKVPDFII